MIQQYIQTIQQLLSRDKIFNFNSLLFWNRFYVFTFTFVIWLFLLSLLGSSLLEKMANPVKFASEDSLILELYPESTFDKTESKYHIIADYLSSQPNVKSFERVPKEKILEIMGNFSGNFKDLKLDVQLPIIITISLKNKSEDTVQTLRLNISQKVKNAYLDTEQELIQRLMGPITTAKYFALIIPIIATIILVSILFLVIYAILFSYKDIIETTLFLGMYKSKLIIEFAWWIFVKSLYSIGFAIVMVILTMGIIFAGFNISIFVIPLYLYLYFISIILIIIPTICVSLGIIFVNRIINKSFL